MSKPYEPSALYRVNDKAGNFLGYLAPSRDGETFYWLQEDSIGLWSCTCEAGQLGRHCCHVDAVSEICGIRAGKQPAKPVAPVVAAKPASEKPAKSLTSNHVLKQPTEPVKVAALATAGRTAPLNGNRGFSMWR